MRASDKRGYGRASVSILRVFNSSGNGRAPYVRRNKRPGVIVQVVQCRLQASTRHKIRDMVPHSGPPNRPRSGHGSRLEPRLSVVQVNPQGMVQNAPLPLPCPAATAVLRPSGPETHRHAARRSLERNHVVEHVPAARPRVVSVVRHGCRDVGAAPPQRAAMLCSGAGDVAAVRRHHHPALAHVAPAWAGRLREAAENRAENRAGNRAGKRGGGVVRVPRRHIRARVSVVHQVRRV